MPGAAVAQHFHPRGISGAKGGAAANEPPTWIRRPCLLRNLNGVADHIGDEQRMQPLLDGGGGAGLTPDADPRFERGQLTAELKCHAIRFEPT
jgi:hypothetical protein